MAGRVGSFISVRTLGGVSGDTVIRSTTADRVATYPVLQVMTPHMLCGGLWDQGPIGKPAATKDIVAPGIASATGHRFPAPSLSPSLAEAVNQFFRSRRARALRETADKLARDR